MTSRYYIAAHGARHHHIAHSKTDKAQRIRPVEAQTMMRCAHCQTTILDLTRALGDPDGYLLDAACATELARAGELAEVQLPIVRAGAVVGYLRILENHVSQMNHDDETGITPLVFKDIA